MNDTKNVINAKDNAINAPKSEFLKIIKERGYFHQCTNLSGLDEVLYNCEQSQKPLVAYIGFDCTAPSLHVGSLMQIMILRHLQQCGHKPIILLGGFTTEIGDPSGKDKARPVLSPKIIEQNKKGIMQVFSNFLQIGEGKTDAIMVDNNDWLGNMPLKDFLQNIGRVFSVNEMNKMDSVKLRLERESFLSYLEFSYPLLQSYDFVELFNRHNCRLQIGGSDQWGNITQGVELQRKQGIFQSREDFYKACIDDCPELVKQHIKLDKNTDFIWKKANSSDELMKMLLKQCSDTNKSWAENPLPENEIKAYFDILNTLQEEKIVFGLTTPLLTTSSGAKMGKTADGAVWLNGDMLSPFDYYQFWRNCDDADVGRFLKLFTELSLEEIKELEALEGASINEAKKRLAYETTKLLHGEAAANAAQEAARKTFEEGTISANLPTITLSIAEIGLEIPAFKLLHLSGLCASGSEGRKLIQGGGARINDAPFANETQIINVHDYANATLKLSSGKKKHILVRFE